MANHLVIMAGGIGSRFWPMSTPTCPKQFLDIMGTGRTMIQQTFDRFGDLIDIKHVWVVTSKNFQRLVAEQLTGIDPQHILLEPCMRNTAPCVAYVSWKIMAEDPSANIFVAASDHLVTDTAAFRRYVAQGLEFIGQGNRILTLGMQPTRPETGYGYIEQGDKVMGQEGAHDIYKLAAFREKPDLATAQQYLATGRYTWNSGMFLWSVKTIVSELRLHAPEIAAIMDEIAPTFFTANEQAKVDELYATCPKISIDYAVMEIFEQAKVDELYATCPKISIDYAVMEKTQLAYVMPAEFGWSDLGTWGSMHTLLPQDAAGNAVVGDGVKIIESEGCMIRMPQGKQVVIQGLKDVIVSEHNGVLLICQLKEEQRIKEWHD